MIWIIGVAVFLLLFILFARMPKKKSLPGTLQERVGVAAALICSTLKRNGFEKATDEEQYMWEAISFILGNLSALGFIDETKTRAIGQNIGCSYKDSGYNRRLSGYRIISGCIFYKGEVEKMMAKEHDMPDVIIYNLTNPGNSRKYFDEIPLLGVDFLKYMAIWADISDIMKNFFFNSSEDISKLPLGE